jgi:hypothetical protein
MHVRSWEIGKKNYFRRVSIYQHNTGDMLMIFGGLLNFAQFMEKVGGIFDVAI